MASDRGDTVFSIGDGEQELAVEPFETPNPWLQKLVDMSEYGRVPEATPALLREVSPDPDERLLAAVKCEHGRLRRGYLLATTTCLRWIRLFPGRAADSWGYHCDLGYQGLSLTKAALVLSTGDQFQTYRTRALHNPPFQTAQASERRDGIAASMRWI